MIADHNQKMLDKKLARGWYTKEQLDRKYGIGQWRANDQFLLWQATAGKYRVISNRRSSGQNKVIK